MQYLTLTSNVDGFIISMKLFSVIIIRNKPIQANMDFSCVYLCSSGYEYQVKVLTMISTVSHIDDKQIPKLHEQIQF